MKSYNNTERNDKIQFKVYKYRVENRNKKIKKYKRQKNSERRSKLHNTVEKMVSLKEKQLHKIRGINTHKE